MITSHGTAKIDIYGVVADVDVKVFNGHSENLNAIKFEFGVGFPFDSGKTSKVKKAKEKLMSDLVKGNKYSMNYPNRHIEFTVQDNLRGLRDTLIRLCADMEEADVEDTVLFERMKNGTTS